MQLSVQTNFPAVAQWLKQYPEQVVRPALARAINRAIDQGSTAMGREIRSEYRLSAQLVRQRLRVERARIKGGGIEITARLRAVGKRATNLIHFLESSATLAEGRRRKAGGTAGQVYVQIKRRGGKKPLGPLAFIGNRGRTVFARVPGTTMPSRATSLGVQHRQAIRPLQTIDVPAMFNARRISAAVVRKITEAFEARISHELRFAAAQHKAPKAIA